MANDLEQKITAKMVLDSTGYNSSIQGLNAEMKKHQSELKLASQGIQSFGKNSESLKLVQESLAKQVELHSKKVDIYKQSIEKTTSKLQENIKKRDELKNGLDVANKKYGETIKLYGKESEEAKKAKEEIDRLKESHKNAEKAVENNAKQMQSYETSMAKANTQLTKVQGELGKVNTELDKSNNKWLNASDRLGEHSKKLESVGKSVTDFGNKLTTHISLPLMGIGVMAGKVGMDFEAEMSKIQAISGATGDDFDKLKTLAEEMGSKTKFSATQSAEGLEYMAMAGWKTEEMLAGLPPILNLATAAGTDLGTTSDIVTDAITAFGLKAKDVGMFSDVLAVASSNANTNVEMMGSTFQYAAPVAGALGYSVQDTALAIGLMANAGIKAEKAGTALRGGLTNLVNPTSEMASSMEKYGLSVTNADGTMKPFRQLIAELRENLGGLDEATQASTVANIFGKEAMSGWLAVINGSEKDLSKLTNAIDNCDGATAKMAETMQDNAKGGITEMKSALEGAGIKVFETLAPHITNIANKVTELANKFSELSPEAQEMIVKMGLLAVAGGPVISGIGAAVAGGLLLAKHLKKDAIPAVDLFADKSKSTAYAVTNANGTITKGSTSMVTKLSKATKTAVGAYMKLDDEATKSLGNLYATSTIITADTVNGMVEKYRGMAKQIKVGMDAQHKEQYNATKAFFEKSSALTTQEELKALEALKLNGENEKVETDKRVAEIQAILQKASYGKRELTIVEQQEIDRIQNEMKETAINTLSESELESKVILERLKEYSTRITAEQASEVIANAEKQRQAGVNEAEQQYEDTLKSIIKMHDETGTITAEQAEQMKQEAIKQKEESIKQAEEMKKGVVTKIGEMNTDVLKNIDTTSGEMKSKGEIMGKNLSEGIGNALVGAQDWLNGIVTRLSEGLVLTANKALEIRSPSRVFFEVGKYVALGLGNGISENGTYATGEMERLANKIINTGDAISTGIIQTDEKTGQVIADNTYKMVMKKIDQYYKDRDKRVSLMTTGTDDNIKQIKREISETEQATNLKIKLYEQEYKARTKLIDDRTNTEVNALQDELDGIDRAEEQRSRDKEEEDYNTQMNTLNRQYNSGDDEEATNAYEQMQRLKADKEERIRRQELADKKDSIRKEMQLARDKAEQEKKVLQEESEAKEYNLQQQRTTEIEHMNKVLELMQAQVEKKNELEKIHTQIKEKESKLQTEKTGAETKKQTKNDLDELKKKEKNLVESINTDEKTLKNFTPKVLSASNDYGKAFLTGFTSTESRIVDYVEKMVSYMRERLASVGGDCDGGSSFARNWTGTNYFQGGLTALHDSPGQNASYELYDLPRGTRIFNHDASEDLVRQTAKELAVEVVSGMMGKTNANAVVNNNFYNVKEESTAFQVKRQTKKALRELGLV